MWRNVLLIALATLGSTLAQAAPTILVFGDSLSAAYGIRQQDGWVTLLQHRLRQQRQDYTVVNASISGETTSGGAARIAATLQIHKPAIVIVELGANDGLRGLPLKQMSANLAAIIRAAQRRGAKVVLVGMRMPPNYGARYTEDFANVFADLAARHKCAFVPFLLEAIAARREFTQDDNLHPTAAAQPLILDTVWKGLAPLLGKR